MKATCLYDNFIWYHIFEEDLLLFKVFFLISSLKFEAELVKTEERPPHS